MQALLTSMRKALEYLASLEPANTVQWHTGYFSSQTPTKSFQLSSSYGQPLDLVM